MLKMAYSYLNNCGEGEYEVFNSHGGDGTSALDGGTLSEAYCYGERKSKKTGRNGSGITQPDGSSYFFKWSGDLSGKGSYVSFSASSDIHSVAVFLEWKNALPCYDSRTGILNPLTDMRIAPTGSGNLNNGTFFNNGPATRNMDSYPNSYAKRTNDKHQGIDLAAEVGTPIFAPCDGIISSYGFYTDMPDRDRQTNQWLCPYDDLEHYDDAGNRLGLECTVNGKKVIYTFWHLEAGNAVAVNPRTGQRFAKGQKIYQGEVIGYVGRTGNAWNVENTHLHLGVRDYETGKWLNPEDYLNGVVNKSSEGKVITSEIINIHCNSAIHK